MESHLVTYEHYVAVFKKTTTKKHLKFMTAHCYLVVVVKKKSGVHWYIVVQEDKRT